MGCSGPSGPTATPWTIVMPPPNVTGSLHIGHALDNHAAGRPDPPRADARQGRAVGGRHRPCRHRHADGGRAQPRRARASSAPTSAARPSSSMCGNGRRNRAARSPASSAASAPSATGRTSASPWTRAFPRPSPTSSSSSTSAGSLYRDKRLVNWDPKFQTAISDLEVETRDVQGKFWTLRYPLADRQRRNRGRDHAARDDARRHGGRGSPGRRALQAADRQADQAPDHRPPDPDHRRRACRSRAWLGRGEDHAGPRLQRL